MAGNVATEKLKIAGVAHAENGTQPDPPIVDFPLLAWAPSQWGNEVYTEDGKASIDQIVESILKLLDFEAVADRYGTTADHVEQAVAYASEAGFIGTG